MLFNFTLPQDHSRPSLLQAVSKYCIAYKWYILTAIIGLGFLAVNFTIIAISAVVVGFSLLFVQSVLSDISKLDFTSTYDIDLKDIIDDMG